MSSHHNAEVLGLTCQLEAEVSKVEKAGRKEAAMEEAHLTLQHDRKEMVCVCVYTDNVLFNIYKCLASAFKLPYIFCLGWIYELLASLT